MSNSSPGWDEDRNGVSKSNMSSRWAKGYHISGKVGHDIGLASNIVQTSLPDLPNNDRHSLPPSPKDLVDWAKAIVSAPEGHPEVIYRDNVSLAQYTRLCKDLDVDGRDKLYPRFYYCSRTQQLSIQVMPSETHNSTPDTINKYTIEWAYSNDLSGTIESKTSQTIAKLTNEDGKCHTRTPDLTISRKNIDGEDDPFLVVESAFAQSLLSLDEATVDYLQNSQGRIKIVIKVGVKEIDQYKTPFQRVDDKDKEVEYTALFEDRNTTAKTFTVDESSLTNGVTYKGHMVINPFDAWLEVWMMGEDGQPRKQGSRTQIFGNNRPTKLRIDFTPYLIPPRTTSCVLNIPRQVFKMRLISAIQSTASQRWNEAVEKMMAKIPEPSPPPSFTTTSRSQRRRRREERKEGREEEDDKVSDEDDCPS